ncbi:uncharacterized protein KD926_001209 [Aspergillus affinis]|uniref:uncharacterized protein n=1 Tax=Aspergillus affinis TaxID=1070780 RepID=UPI0022FE78C5|nr:uncharacterized protein KD926_001209 [Aspergillus affinis]KAI9036894.1 hypothetical protein KD926_001209 [Aspergillus affinis]
MASASDKFVYYKTLSHDDCTVGWICALPVVLTAAKGMLDKRHESLPQPTNDNNNYVLGEVAGHNVVIACLPIGEYGTTSAATVAAQMLLTFSQIRCGLMVGIGGGVPTTVDIRLGDVVVSNPTDGYGGVIHMTTGRIVCFEMDAAGLMNISPCLVIRGICDYSDSHKNKKWQPYAAATAAAVTATKALTGPGTLTVDDPARFLALSQRPEWALVHQVEQPKNIFQRLSDYDPDRIHRSHLWNRCPNTTEWSVENPAYKAWLDGSASPFLWLTGKIGCGKTLVSSTGIQHLKAITQGSRCIVAHFFYSHSNRSKLEARHVFESYIKQIVGHLDSFQIACPGPIRSFIKRFYENDQQIPTFSEIVHEILVPLCHSRPGIIFIMDGLDECYLLQILEVFEALREISRQRSVKVFLSGREGLDLPRAIPSCATINIADDGSNDDLRAFVEWKIQTKLKERQLTENESVLQEIRERLLEKAGHMILWVNLQLEMLWDECYTDGGIRQTLNNLPKDLSTTYDRCLARISGKKPFTGSQLQDAVALNLRTGLLDLDGFVPVKELVKYCAHLITWKVNDEIHLSHYSISRFLESKGGGHDSWFADIDLDDERAALGDLCMKHLLSPIYSRAVVPIEKPKQAALVLDQNSTWNIHPWEPSGMSMDSHYAGILGYSIVEHHNPLLAVLMRARGLQPRTDIFRLPLHPYNNLLPLHLAATAGNGDCLVQIMGQSTFNMLDVSGQTALHHAAVMGHLDVTQILLSKSMLEINQADNDGRTALHLAASHGQEHLLDTLFLYNANINQQDDLGQTALHLAVTNKKRNLAKALLARQPDISITNKAARSPLSIAAHGSDEAMVRLILQAEYHSGKFPHPDDSFISVGSRLMMLLGNPIVPSPGNKSVSGQLDNDRYPLKDDLMFAIADTIQPQDLGLKACGLYIRVMLEAGVK